MERQMKSNARLMTLTLAWAALLLMRSTAFAVPGKLTDDSYTQASSSTNFGLIGVLHVQAPPASATTEKSFIQFDLDDMTSALPAVSGSDVEKASLTVFVNGVGAAGSFDVYAVTS